MKHLGQLTIQIKQYCNIHVYKQYIYYILLTLSDFLDIVEVCIYNVLVLSIILKYESAIVFL